MVQSEEPSPEIIKQRLNYIGVLLDKFNGQLLTEILNADHQDFFSSIYQIIDMPDCFDVINTIISILVEQSVIMEDSNHSIIELLNDNEIIEKLYSIWVKNLQEYFNLISLNTFTQIMNKHPESKPFFIEKNTLENLFQFLHKYNNSQENDKNSARIVINIIDFFAEYFHNNENVDVVSHAQFIKEIIIIFNNTCQPYKEDQPKDNEDIIAFWESCISAFNNFASNKPAKARLLINYELPKSLFLYLNSDSFFRSQWPQALQLILKLLKSEHDELENLADIYIDFTVFMNISKEEPSIHVINTSLIFSALIDINPSKYAALIASSEIIDIILNRAKNFSFHEFMPIIILYCKIFLNISSELALSKMLDEDIIEKLVDTSEVEIDMKIIEDLKVLFLAIYEISESKPEIQNIIDRAFEEDGILFDVPKPLMI